MKNRLQSHLFINCFLIVGGWLSLWSPVLLRTTGHQDYDVGEAALEYSRFVIFNLAPTFASLVPITITAMYFWLKTSSPSRNLAKRPWLFAYLPALGLSLSNLYVSIYGIFHVLSFIVPMVWHFALLVHLAYSYPRKTMS
jgi:hypothetical protein